MLKNVKRVWVAGLALLPVLAAVLTAQQAAPDARVKHFQDLFAAMGGKAPAGAASCVACHLGIADPAWRVDEEKRRKGAYVFADADLQKRMSEKWKAPTMFAKHARAFMAHPRLDLMARHAKVACLDCHGADDRKKELATEKERERWTAGYVRYHEELKSQAIVLTKYAQASCRGCHGREVEVLDGAETYALGARLMEGTACYACHEMPGFSVREREARRPGPPLTHIQDKMDRTFAYHFLLDPESFRPATRMPRFFRRRGDKVGIGPQFSPDENVVIAASIVEYLWSIGTSRGPAAAPPRAKDDEERDKRVARGRDIVEQVGCTGCHRTDELYPAALATGRYSRHLQEFGPNLVGLGDKFDSEAGRAWLAAWLHDPSAYFKDTRMPSLRLADDERRDVIEYLCSLTVNLQQRRQVNHERDRSKQAMVPLWSPQPAPVRLEDEVVLEGAAGPTLAALVARFKLAGAGPRDQVLALGKHMVGFFGCYSCHEIAGEDWATRAPPGDPWKVSILPGKGVFERMPFSSVSPDEWDALATYLLADLYPSRAGRPATDREKAIFKGRRVLWTYNCDGCHELESARVLTKDGWRDAHGLADPMTLAAAAPAGDVLDRRAAVGGGIAADLKRHKKEVLEIAYEHDGHLAARMPPSLRAEGTRARADWLRTYLKSPHEIRPLLRTRRMKSAGGDVEEFNVRMPTFALKDGDIDAIVAYFVATGAPGPDAPAPSGAADNAAVETIRASCGKCHPPDPDAWAPDLAKVEARLRPAYLAAYLKDPLAWDGHSMMPAYNPKDARELKAVVEALRLGK